MITYVRKNYDTDPVSEVASRMEGRFRKAFLDAVEVAKESIAFGKLREAFAAGDATQVLAILAVDERFAGALQGQGLEAGIRSLRTAVQEAFAEGAKAAEKALPKSIGVKLSFNLMNPEATNWLNSYTFNLIQQVTAETTSAIRQVLLRAFKEGGHPREQAREIRDMIGLTARQEMAVQNYRKALESGGQGLRTALQRSLRDGRYDRTLLRSLADNANLSQAQVDAMVERYRKKYLNYRATTIARTESIRASQAGQNALWRQAQAQGVLKEGARRVWIASGDDRTCDVCVSLNGKTAPIDGNFPGGYSGPPEHPNCRCTTALVFETSTKPATGGLFVVEESDHERERRMNMGYTKIVRVDAAAFAEKFEEDNREKLIWNPPRAERLRTLPTVNAYPKVYVDPYGKLSILDGRHRLGVAAERGQRIDVAVPPGTTLPTGLQVKKAA